MKQQNPWLVTELRLLTEAFKADPNVSPAALHAMLPRHTRSSIDAKRLELGLSRQGIKRHRPAWAAISKLLESGPKRRRDIAKELGCCEQNVRHVLSKVKGCWRVAGWVPSTHYSVMIPLIGLGSEPDAPYPKKSRRRAVANPFDVAAGLVQAPTGQTGRVIAQSMEVDEWVHKGLREAA